jgi:hypothetical protein
VILLEAPLVMPAVRRIELLEELREGHVAVADATRRLGERRRIAAIRDPDLAPVARERLTRQRQEYESGDHRDRNSPCPSMPPAIHPGLLLA